MFVSDYKRREGRMDGRKEGRKEERTIDRRNWVRDRNLTVYKLV
jgi:hypothetical protein